VKKKRVEEEGAQERKKIGVEGNQWRWKQVKEPEVEKKSGEVG
jgi:hypothetical protein